MIRDLAVQSGIPMNIEDTWGGDIVTAAIAHLAHSTPPKVTQKTISKYTIGHVLDELCLSYEILNLCMTQFCAKYLFCR